MENLEKKIEEGERRGAVVLRSLKAFKVEKDLYGDWYFVAADGARIRLQIKHANNNYCALVITRNECSIFEMSDAVSARTWAKFAVAIFEALKVKKVGRAKRGKAR